MSFWRDYTLRTLSCLCYCSILLICQQACCSAYMRRWFPSTAFLLRLSCARSFCNYIHNQIVLTGRTPFCAESGILSRGVAIHHLTLMRSCLDSVLQPIRTIRTYRILFAVLEFGPPKCLESRCLDCKVQLGFPSLAFSPHQSPPFLFCILLINRPPPPPKGESI